MNKNIDQRVKQREYADKRNILQESKVKELNIYRESDSNEYFGLEGRFCTTRLEEAESSIKTYWTNFFGPA